MHPGLAARLTAATMIAEAVTKGHRLDERSSEETGHGAPLGLEPRDMALARSIALAALRRLGTIRKGLARFLQRGLPRRAGDLEWHLIAGAVQILFLDVPDHAAVDLAVLAVRMNPDSSPFAAVANAVLRNIARNRTEIAAAGDPLDDDTPPWLAERWTRTYGEALARQIAAAHGNEPTLDLTVRADPEGWAAKLDGMVLPGDSVRLRTHRPIPELEGYAEGEWWVQDAAAAFAARLVAARPGDRIADLCAAPGGKTALLAAAGAEVVAVDRSEPRLQRLRANLQRLRLDAEVVVADVLQFDAPPFDAVLLDAPCSATGTIRRHPDVAWSKHPGDIEKLAAVQTRLLDRVAMLVRPGGRLVYCTCSLEPEEGEAQIAPFLARHAEFSRDPVQAKEIGGLAECIDTEGDLRTLPTHLAGPEPRLSGLDGFFAARLVRRG